MGCDPTKLRVLNGQVLVRMDPDKETVAGGLLVKPETAHEHVLRTGEVIQVGSGKRSKKTGEHLPMTLQAGDGVLFIRFMADTKTSESLQHHIGKDHVLLKEDDVLLAYDRSNPPEFSQ
jgi:co-chaperonin GroES (HSP10)